MSIRRQEFKNIVASLTSQLRRFIHRRPGKFGYEIISTLFTHICVLHQRFICNNEIEFTFDTFGDYSLSALTLGCNIKKCSEHCLITKTENVTKENNDSEYIYIIITEYLVDSSDLSFDRNLPFYQ